MTVSSRLQRYSVVVLVIFTLVLLSCLYNKRNYFDLQHRCKGCRELSSSRRNHVFQVKNTISFPYNHSIQSLDYILHTKWIESLQSYLTELEEKQVFLVSANERYLETLLNWLSAVKLHTQIQFINILILALDRRIHISLDKRGIKSILLGDDDIILPDTKFRTSSSHIWIKRCTVTRLLNHWGYDVIMMDLDAIILKDPRPLFKRFKGSDIVGSRGTFPRDLYRKWGVTLRMGTVMFRSTSAIETFWETSSIVDTDAQHTDQFKVNSVLQYLHIIWFAKSAHCKDIKTCEISGITKNKLNVTLLSHDSICLSCDQHHIDEYYVWHKQENQRKETNIWYLKDNWKDIWQTPPVSGDKLIELLIKKNG